MSHLKADSDGSINLDWILAIGFDNRLIFSFTDAAGGAADISNVTSFTLQVWKEGSPTDIFELTESAGNLIRGTGELEAVIGVSNSNLLKNKGEYLWQMSVVYPGPTRSRWYNGTIFASSGLHTNTVNNSTATINIGGVTVTATATIAIGGVTSFNGATGDITFKKVIQAACSDETTAITATTDKITFRTSYAMTVTEVRASLTTTQASGNIFTVDIHKNGVTILSTKITIDNGEETSVTALTAPVISVTSIADDDEITVDVDQIGDGTAKGLKVTIIGT